MDEYELHQNKAAVATNLCISLLIPIAFGLTLFFIWKLQKKNKKLYFESILLPSQFTAKLEMTLT